MAQLSLRINIVDSNVTKTMVFDPSTTVYDACKLIREKITEANLGQRKSYFKYLFMRQSLQSLTELMYQKPETIIVLISHLHFTKVILLLAKEYGLFLTDDDNKTGVWLEPARHLEYYILRNGDTLEYRKKLRILRVKMLDGELINK